MPGIVVGIDGSSCSNMAVAEGSVLATELGHPYTKLESFNSALNIALLDGDVDTLLRHAAALQVMVDDGALPVVAASYANGFRANALVLAGDLDAAVRNAVRLLSRPRATSVRARFRCWIWARRKF